MIERRILVTGGSGFLGSHLCDRLVLRGDDVICADNLFTGRKRNIAHLLDAHTLSSFATT
ncbi:MAG: NAD-dependent epimerase/dehydratase family protein [Hyphomonadaceae bacterium]